MESSRFVSFSIPPYISYFEVSQIVFWSRFLGKEFDALDLSFILPFYFLLSIFYWLCYYSCPSIFLPFTRPLPCTAPLTLQHSPPLSSCPWVVHISSLASLFPILFLTYPCLFYAYQLCLLFPVPLPSHGPPPSIDNPACDLHFCNSVLVVHFVFVFCFLGSVVDSYIGTSNITLWLEMCYLGDSLQRNNSSEFLCALNCDVYTSDVWLNIKNPWPIFSLHDILML